MSSRPIPNFLLVGAIKCGTSSLACHFRQHPQIFFSTPKEPSYMIRQAAVELDFRSRECPWSPYDTFDEYLKLFDNAHRHIAIGEGSTHYLALWRFVIPRIRELLGDPRIIICLRNPVERALAHFDMIRRWYNPVLTFEECFSSRTICPELDALFGENRIIHYGRYFAQVSAYIENFSRVHIVILEDLQSHPTETLKKVFKFLGVSDQWTPNIGVKANRGGSLRFPKLHEMFRSRYVALEPAICKIIGRRNAGILRVHLGDLAYKTEKVSKKYVKDLFDLYSQEIESVEILLDRSLPQWRIVH